jgi:hypothetical protein
VTIRARTVFQVILIPWQHNDDEIALRAKETTLIRPLGPMLNHPFTDLLLQNIALLSSFLLSSENVQPPAKEGVRGRFNSWLTVPAQICPEQHVMQPHTVV